MPQQITPYSITSPGFYGLNLQDSPTNLDPGYALSAINCIIDQSGRIAARKGWVALNSANVDLGTANITCLGEVVQNNGTTTIVATGNNKLYTYASGTLTTLTYGGGGVAPTISANNWQFCQISGVGIFWQRGYDPLIFEPSVSTTTYRRLSERAGSAGTVQQANAAISAYGRIWCADLSADKNTIYWSDVLTPHIWSGGSSGSLNLLGVWPKGGDEIVSLAAHNNFLIIFGKRQTLVYSGANTPSTMALQDSLPTIGCIARDSVQNTGDDVIFLSDSGIRALMRTIQEKSAPLREISANIREELQVHISTETMDNIKSIYSPTNGFYLITMPAASETYCFDLRQILPNGAARPTTWNMVPTAFCHTSSRLLYMGFGGYIGNYSGYLDNVSSYRMSYYTPWIDFGNPIQKSILKKILSVVIGGTNQSIVFKWAFDFNQTYFSDVATITNSYPVAEYGIAEYGYTDEYGGGSVAVNNMSVNGSSNGTVIQLGFESDINNASLSFQKISIFTKEGRL